MIDSKKTRSQLIAELDMLLTQLAGLQDEGQDARVEHLEREPGDRPGDGLAATKPEIEVARALRESEEKWHALTLNSDDIIVIVDREDVIRYVNRTISSTTPEEVVGRSLYEYVQEDHHDVMRDALKRVYRTEKPDGYEAPLDMSAIDPGADTLWFSSKVVPIRSEGGITSVIIIASDITERKLADEALQERTHALGERVKELHCLYQASLLMSKVDATIDEICRGMVSLIPQSWQYPAITAARMTLEKSQASSEDFRETQWMHTVDISAFGKKMGQLEVCYLEERPAADEGPFLREEKHLMDGLARDIGKFVERNQALAELEHKNRELEQVMYVASHDLRSPLVNVQGFCGELGAAAEELTSAVQGLQIPEEAREKLAYLLEEDIPESLRFIVAGAERMDVLLKGLLEVSRVGSAALSIEPLEMNHLVSVVIAALEYQIKETGATVEVVDLPSCRGDAAQIGQLFANLVGNALQYLDPDRPGVVKIHGTRQKGESVYCVEDNGIGIDIEHQEKVFEIYHRLHPERSTGEGLGLTIIQKIAARHDGRVRLESEVGEGSRFFVALPSGNPPHYSARRATRRKRK